MSDVIENVSSINVKEFPVEIIWIGERGEIGIKIGDRPAEIAEPKPNILEQGFVFLGTEDIDEIDWEDLISCDIPGLGKCEGFTDDPRLVDLGRKVFNGKSFDLKPGTIIPTQEKE
jgi:hypothetical protein